MSRSQGELALTAAYTAQVARWAGLRGAELFDAREGRIVFWLTNLFTAMGSLGRGPTLRHTLRQRQLIFERLVRREAPAAVLELACGFSARGDRLSAEGRAVVEVDVAPVIRLKEELLARSATGREVLARQNLRRVAADLAEVELEALAPAEDPLLVTAEGLLMYLDAEQQRAFWARVARLLGGRGGVLLFDLLPGPEEPPEGLAGRLLGRLMRRFTGGRGFQRDARGRRELVAELRAQGFHEVELWDPARAATDLGLPVDPRSGRLLLFLGRVAADGEAGRVNSALRA